MSTRGRADVEHLYANRASEMFLLAKAGSGPPVMLMKFSYVLAQKIENQVSAGRAYRRAKDTSMLGLDRALRNNKLMGEFLLERLRGMLKLKGDRKPSPEENQVIQRMRQEAQDLEQAKQTFEAEKVRLVRNIELAREAWENAALPVEDILQDVFIQCGLIDEPSTGKDQLAKKAADEGSLENNRAYIKLGEKRARRDLQEAQRQYEQHRDTFRRRLAAYIAGVVDRPDASKRLLQEEFSQDHVWTGCELIGAVKRAETAHEALLAAAAEAQVSIVGSDDDMDPNVPYDDEDYAAVKIKNLDHDAIEAWTRGVVANAKPNLRPVGYVLHKAEKWKRALEADDDVSNSGEEWVSDTGIENNRDPSATCNSMSKPLSQSKSKEADRYLSVSECAEGKKRQRIEDWTQKMRSIES